MDENKKETDKFKLLLAERRHKDLIGAIIEGNDKKEALVKAISEYQASIILKFDELIKSNKEDDNSEKEVNLSDIIKRGFDSMNESIKKLVESESESEFEDEQWEFTVFRDDYGEKIKSVTAKKVKA